ncbi:hypothetical protein CEXT_37591 [Caerostris extrusa]|uniref:Secreted protein n=1 Tax=Caerostris extrusa TaxID=172846 RepID=A0AAV4UEJ8_CAEEX|nr:hypothetical protein CEXT_37591 [Caerostris extrusa]
MATGMVSTPLVHKFLRPLLAFSFCCCWKNTVGRKFWGEPITHTTNWHNNLGRIEPVGERDIAGFRAPYTGPYTRMATLMVATTGMERGPLLHLLLLALLLPFFDTLPRQWNSLLFSLFRICRGRRYFFGMSWTVFFRCSPNKLPVFQLEMAAGSFLFFYLKRYCFADFRMVFYCMGSSQPSSRKDFDSDGEFPEDCCLPLRSRYLSGESRVQLYRTAFISQHS